MEFEITDYDVLWSSYSDDAYRNGRYTDIATVTAITAEVHDWDSGEVFFADREKLEELFGYHIIRAAEESIASELQ